MFTLDQINEIHERFGKKTELADYLKALKAIGIRRYESFITDGHSEYFGENDEKLNSPALHKKLNVSSEVDHENFLKHLSAHNEGKTSYLEMSQGLAESGIEKWTFDTDKMTITYYDVSGAEMLVEEIE